MRNMKRVLSLVLAMVMLLGMLTIPAGAASNFTDADQIVNTEAVDITAGMGLFAGSDGKFDPQGTVTRAQMATIIVKMMYGSDFNADTFKGAGNPFPDTAGFEGGWAEGYINACFQMGVVKGYGDGTFKPGNQVTTAEAVTMIINALKVDAGEGEWPNTVMAKATEMKLFGDLKPAPATNTALIRDQLAVITLEGLQYSPSGSNTYTYTTSAGKTFEFASLEDAMTTVGVENAESLTVTPAEDTLAKKVYNLKIETGFVTDNQATGADYTVVGGVDFDVETGLDMIGHYVSVYYQEPKSGQSVDAYKAYAVIDESEVVTVSEDITTSKDFKAAFGRSYEPAESVKVFENDYRLSEATTIAGSYTAGSVADAGTYIINENKIVAYLKPATKYASYIASISEFDGEKTYMLGGMMDTIAEEDITLYVGAAKDDVVTYVKAKDQYVLEPVDPVKGTITKTGKNTDGKDVLTLNGQEYVAFGTANNVTDDAELTIVVDTATFEYGEQYTVYLTQDNKIVGWKLTEGGAAGEVDVDKIVYAKGAFSKTDKDSYGVRTTRHYLQAVNTEGTEVHILLGEGDMLGNYTGNNADYIEGFYVVEDYNDPEDPKNKDAKKAGIQVVTPVGIRDNRGEPMGETSLTYSADLFYGANRWGGSTIKMPASNVNFHVCTTGCTQLAGGAGPDGAEYHKFSDTNSNDKNTFRGFFNDSTKFLMVKGEFGETLKCGVGDEDFSYTLTGSSAMTLPVLLTEDDSGLLDVVMVVIPKDPNDLAASYPMIYVTGEIIGSTAEGDLVEAYLANKATATDVLVRPGTEVTKGFKSYTIDDNGWFVMEASTSDNAYEDMVINAITSAGLLNAFDPNYVEGSTEKMQTPSGANASKAVILDLRSEENVKASGVGTITDLEQLRTLRENGYVINADIYASSTTVSTIYVTSTYKVDSNVEYYVTAAGKAGVPVPAYNTKTGAAVTVTVTEHSDVLGFATVVEGSYSSSLVASVGDNYYMGEVASGMTASGDNVVITSRNGETVTITPSTVIAKTDAAITGPATLKAAYDALPGSESYTYSYNKGANGEASFFIIIDKGDPDVAEGDVIKTTGLLTATDEASVVEDAWKVTGNLAGEKHSINCVAIAYPESVNVDELTATGEYYYVASKDDQGQITLTFSHNYEPAAGEVIFVPGTVKAGDAVEGYVMNRAGIDPKQLVYIGIPSDAEYYTDKLAAGASTHTLGRFWEVKSSGILTGMQGIWGTKYVYTYHDTIVSWNGTTLETENADGHSGSAAACGYNFSYSCGGDKQQNEASPTLTVPAGVKIIDLTGNNCQSVNDIKLLTDAGNAVINIYVPGGAQTSGTASVIIVLDPKADFEANCMVRVEPAVGGEVSVDPAFGPVDTIVTVTATAEDNYDLTAILVDGEAIEGNTFAIAGDHTVTATFTEKPKYNVSVGTVANGDVTLSAEGQVYRDTEITVTAVPSTTYKLTAIQVNGAPIEGNTFVVTGDAVVTATFEVCTEIHTVTAGDCENGAVGTDLATGTCGQTVTVTATPNAGYELDKIFVDGDEIDGNTFNITGDHTVTATFAKVYAVADISTDGTLTFSKDVARPGETVTVTGAADTTGYSLVAIEVDGVQQDTLSFTMGEADCEVEGIFAYAPQVGDVFFIPGAVTGAKTVVEGYVIDTVSTALDVGDTVDIWTTANAKFRNNVVDGHNTGRFWEMTDSKFQSIYNVTLSPASYDAPGAHRYGYHDAIGSVDTTTGVVVIQDGQQHRAGSGSSETAKACQLGFADTCGSTGWPSQMTAYNVGPTLTFEEGTSVIIDLRDVSAADKIDTLAELATLAVGTNKGGKAGDPVVNTYSADAIATSKGDYATNAGTITVMVIIDG